MSRIEVRTPRGVRKGESCSLLIKVPETNAVKEVAIKVPTGVHLPDGNIFRLAPKVKSANIPVTFSQTAPDRIRVKIKLEAKSGERYELVKSFKIRR